VTRVDGITRQVISHAHNVGFTSSLDMLLSVSNVTIFLKMKGNRQRELNISRVEWTAASDISCSQCRFHLIFVYVVWRIQRHRSTTDEVKVTARTRYITCGVDGIMWQVIIHAHNGGFTSSFTFGTSTK
jgi:hypothetical protein